MTPHLNPTSRPATPPDAVASLAMTPTIDLDQEQLDPRLAAALPRAVAERYRIVPLRMEGDRLVVAAAAPITLAALEAARTHSGKPEVLGVVASNSSIARALDRLYGTDLRSLATTQPLNPIEIERAIDARSDTRPVVLYGWPELQAQHLAQALLRHGIRSQVLTPSQIGLLAAHDVVVAPIPAIEALTRKGQTVHYRLIAAGRMPDFDLPRAHALGAKSFILSPVDTQLLLRAVRRCRAEEVPAGLEAHGAA